VEGHKCLPSVLRMRRLRARSFCELFSPFCGEGGNGDEEGEGAWEGNLEDVEMARSRRRSEELGVLGRWQLWQ